MNEEGQREKTPGGVAMPTTEAERVMELLAATGEVHPDLMRVLSEPQAEQIVEGIMSDEIQDQRT